MVLPDGASLERTREVVRRYEEALMRTDGVRDVLALSECPFDRSPAQSNRAFLLIRLTPAGEGRASREAIAKPIRGAFRQFPEAVLRLRDLSAPGVPGGYPVRLAVHTRADLGASDLQAAADALADRLSRDAGLTDVFSTFRANVPSLLLEINRKEAARLGVAVDQIEKALRPAVGQNQPGSRERLEQLRLLRVPNGRGAMVPLAAVVRVREVSGPTVIDRLDLEPMAEITANLAPGVSLAEARARCEEEARTTLPQTCRLTWLSEMLPAQEAK